MNFPLIPNSRKGTIVAILLIILTFSAYYLWPNFYSKLLNFYRDGMYIPPYQYSFGPDNSLQVQVMIPLQTSAAIPRWAYVMVVNNSASDTVNNVQIRIELQDSKTHLPIIHPLLPSLFKIQADQQSSFESAVPFKIIYPLSSVSGRILLISESKNPVDVIVYGIYDSADGKPKKVQLPIYTELSEDLSKTLIYSLIESVLLPPWLNIIIPILVLVIISLVEQPTTSKTSEPESNSIRGFIIMLFSATLVLLAIILYGYLFFFAILRWGPILWLVVFFAPIILFVICYLITQRDKVIVFFTNFAHKLKPVPFKT